MVFDDEGNISIRQSWLDTAFRCPERGRQAIIRPDWDSLSSDSAIIGTATHAGIEARIGGADPYGAINVSLAAETAGGVKWTKYTTMAELHDNAVRCYRAWEKSILPRLEDFAGFSLLDGARTEVQFKVPLYTHRDGRTVSITGTVDFVPNSPVLWDWKTASAKFRHHEKQKYAIQPTIYSLAAIKGGLDSEDHPKVNYVWPMTFVYGIAVRGAQKAVPQVMAVRRTEEHALHAIERIKGLVDLALDYGLDKRWPMNDDHFLCSQTWCPWWSVCKGAHAIDNSYPSGYEAVELD